jgi:hypothetical protein
LFDRLGANGDMAGKSLILLNWLRWAQQRYART